MFRSAPLSSSSGQETPSLPDSAVDHELVLFFVLSLLQGERQAVSHVPVFILSRLCSCMYLLRSCWKGRGQPAPPVGPGRTAP